MTEHMPPQDIEAEQAVLGAILTSGGHVLPALDGLRAEDFYRPAHSELYARLLALHHAGQAVDAITVAAHLAQQPLRGIDGPYLHTLMASLPSIANAPWYARIVRDRALVRAVIAAGQRVTQIGWQGATAEDVLTVAEDARAVLDEATGNTPTQDPDPIVTGLSDVLKALEHPTKTTPTPWPELDHLISGWAPGRLYVVGARPGVGKSVFGLQAAAALAEAGIPAALFTLEMSRAEVQKRLLSMTCGIPFRRIERHDLADSDHRALAAAAARIGDWPLYVDDRTTIRPAEIRARVRSLNRRHQLGLVVVDYLQLMSNPTSKQPRHEIVAEFSRALKLLAKELDVPVLALSQLNRAAEQRADKMPSLGDLRESGAVEQDSDVVVLLHRAVDNDATKNDLATGVAKNRHGSTGHTLLRFEGHHCRIASPPWDPSAVLKRVS